MTTNAPSKENVVVHLNIQTGLQYFLVHSAQLTKKIITDLLYTILYVCYEMCFFCIRTFSNEFFIKFFGTHQTIH